MVRPCMEKQHAMARFKLTSVPNWHISCGINIAVHTMFAHPCCRCILLKLSDIVTVMNRKCMPQIDDCWDFQPGIAELLSLARLFCCAVTLPPSER